MSETACSGHSGWTVAAAPPADDPPAEAEPGSGAKTLPRTGSIPAPRARIRSRCAAHSGTAHDFQQTQPGPQLQALPQRQPARRAVWAAWQPQVQVFPAQVSQVQVFESVFMMFSSWVALTSLSTRRTIASGDSAEIGRSRRIR